MKKRIIIVVFWGGSLFASAQKNAWTMGLYTVQGQLTTAVERNYALKAIVENGKYVIIDMEDRWWGPELGKINNISQYPPIELKLQYNITDNFSVSSGIGYANYLTRWKNKYNSVYPMAMEPFADNTYLRRVSIQIPCNIRYDIRVKNTGFSVFSKLGLYLDFPVAFYRKNIGFDPSIFLPYPTDTTAYYSVFETKHMSYSGGYKFNLLINAGLGVAYQFKSGLGLSLSGEYNVGTMRSDRFNYHLQIKELYTDIVSYEYDYWIYNRKEYWNVLFGITYTFKKKEKKTSPPF